jgi:pyruvate/2-oxoglutarate dehydrogenase complex dihydrolipoamide acyltransferase (E2) component
MPTPVKMPRLGESVAEGTIGAWLKKEGDYVERDESLAEVITDKITAELPSPVAGRLTKILAQVDQTVTVGTDIALIEEETGVSAEASAPVETPSQAVPSNLDATPAYEAVHVGTAGNGAVQAEEERQRISPLARRLAREHGINLNEIAGTGLGGRVRKEDILAYIAQRKTAPDASTVTITPLSQPITPSPVTHPPAPPTAPVVPQPMPVAASNLDEEIVEPSRMRLAIAEHMVRSKHISPHATTVVEVDMTKIAKWLAAHKEEFKQRNGYGISFVPFVMKAVCEGIRKYPIINSSWTEDNKIVIKKRINLGIAVATDVGLVVPVVHDADQYTLAGLAKRVNDLAQRARANKLTFQDMQGGTFVVNNPGVFGTIISVPIINQPNAGILSMDAVVKRPVVTEDDAIAVRHMMYLCLSFDHRLLDGAGAGGFLQAIRAKLQSYGPEIDVY